MHNARLVQRLRATEPSDQCAFAPTPQGVPALSLQGAQLCSRHRPLEEADRFAAAVNILDHATIVILGFAAGYHVQRLAERVRKTSLIIVYEPDMALLRAVLEQVDHSAWLAATNITILDDPHDRSAMAVQLAGAEGIVAQGTTIESHLPSRARLRDSAPIFGKTFADLVSSIRTTMLTTLVHSSTTCRNLCLNLDHYAAGDGIAPLEGVARGRTALLIAAGPSLSRHYERLADPNLRERVVLIAAQTCLRPLLRRGIRPHFVTALDYHEISRQFYDGLNPDDLRDVTLVCEPKVNRIVIESYPGPIRCVASGFLDKLLGPLKRDMGAVTAGSTVAHLSFYFAQFLGCDPIVLVGQDLGFTDGLYYGPGAAIHDQWAPEINPFNTIDMMEWSRVARMKRNLRESKDQSGRPMLVDEQMSTYLTQFERDFATAPQTIIDSAGGGVAKQHTVVRPLEAVLVDAGTDPLPHFPSRRTSLDPHRLRQTIARVESIRSDVKRLEHVSRETEETVAKMIDSQLDAPAMSRLFKKINANQNEVGRLGLVHDLVNLVNQLGVFKRLKADRRLELTDTLDALARQKAQLERDRTNVGWMAEACAETQQILDEALRLLKGQSVSSRVSHRVGVAAGLAELSGESGIQQPRRIAAMMAVDPHRSGLLIERSLDDTVAGRTVLQATLERLGRCERIESIVLIAPRGFEIRSLIDEARIGRPVVVREVDGPIFDEHHRAAAIARRWSDWSWRGGIGGMTIFDELIAPSHMDAVMQELQLDAVVVIGPDWPLVDWTEQTGCDALVARYLEQPQAHRLVFTQAPPGLCGVLIEATLMREMAERSRQFTLGSMLSYIPSLPQLDPTSKDACVKLPAEIRNHAGRYVWDTTGATRAIRSIASAVPVGAEPAHGEILVSTLANQASADNDLPQQIEIELTTRRVTRPFWIADPLPTIDMDFESVERLLRQAAARPDLALTFGGRGDPLLYPQFERVIALARDSGCTAIHVRTDLPGEFGDVARLLDLPIDVISVELHAESAATYRSIMGVDRFDELSNRLDALINARNTRCGSANALITPWIVPRLVRCNASIGEMRNFYDRWCHYVGAALIDPVPIPAADTSIQLDPPPTALTEMNHRLLQVHASGDAFVGYQPWLGPDSHSTTNLNLASLAEIWASLQAQLRLANEPDHDDAPTLILELGVA